MSRYPYTYAADLIRVAPCGEVVTEIKATALFYADLHNLGGYEPSWGDLPEAYKQKYRRKAK